MDVLPADVLALFLHGVAKAAQVRRRLGRRRYEDLLHRGVLLHRPGRLVLHPPLVNVWTPIAEIQVRCPTAVASHRLACWIHRVAPYAGRVPPGLDHISTRRSRIATVRETSRLLPEDVMVVAGLRVTTPQRTLADIGAAAGADGVERAGEAMLHARLVTEELLLGTVLRMQRRGRSGVPQLRRFLERRGEGTPACESDAETRFLICVRSLGFPEPTWRQFPVPRIGKQPYRVDFVWAVGNYLVFAEIDGVGTHANPDALRADLDRQNYIGRGRPGLVRFTPDVVDGSPATVEAALAAHIPRRRRARRSRSPAQLLDLAAAS